MALKQSSLMKTTTMPSSSANSKLVVEMNGCVNDVSDLLCIVVMMQMYRVQYVLLLYL